MGSYGREKARLGVGIALRRMRRYWTLVLRALGAVRVLLYRTSPWEEAE